MHYRRCVIIVLPVYNEAAGIESLLTSITEALEESNVPHAILAVNDGSTDGSAAVLERCARSLPSLRVLEHERNMGLGATIRDGLSAAARDAGDRDIVITMDADETHAPGLILRLVRMIREGHDVVIASRYQPGSRVVGLSFHRRLLSSFASLFLRALFPIKGVRDYTCGYRAYRADVLKAAIASYGESFVDQNGFQCMVDILLKLRRQPLVFGEAPMILRYDLKQGLSKMNVGETIAGTLSLVLRRRFGRS